MKKILIISHFVPPTDTAGSVRIYKIAKQLSGKGYDVKVLTSKKYSFDPENTYIRNMDNIEIIEVPYWPFEKLKKYSRPWENVNNQDIGKKNISTKTKVLFFIKRIKHQFGTLIDVYDFWVSPASKKAIELHKKWEYDIIISSHGPAASHKIASKLKKKFSQLYWIADYRDLWSGNYTRSLPKIISKLEQMMEYQTVKNSDLIVTVSEPLKEELEKLFIDKPIHVLYNGYDKLDNLIKTNDQKNVVKIVYTGGIYDKQDPKILFDTIALFDEEKQKKYQIDFYGNVNKHAMGLIDANDFVKYYGIVSRDKALSIQKSADILLLLEWNDPKQKGVVTSKLFDYLSTQIPILSVGDFRNESANIIEDIRIGKFCSNTNDIEDFLLNYQEYKPDIKKIQFYSMEFQINKLIQSISKNIGS